MESVRGANLLLKSLRHDAASKTGAREFVDSVLNARWSILTLQ
jgi:hypothetical protein